MTYNVVIAQPSFTATSNILQNDLWQWLYFRKTKFL